MSRQNPHDKKNGPGNAPRSGGSNQRRGQKRRRKPQVGGPAPDAASLLSVRSTLEDAEYIVFDIETTGGNPEKNGITEIFAVKYKNGEPGETFSLAAGIPHFEIYGPQGTKALVGRRRKESAAA